MDFTWKGESDVLRLLLRLTFFFLRVEEKNTFLPPLPYQEEKRCFERMKQGDRSAREKLILHNMRLVAHLVKKYTGSEKDNEDLISIGTIGLIKAIDSFDVKNGVRFATYAGKCLQNEILMYFRSQKKMKHEVSINDTIDMDKDGNPLTYMDVICCEESVADEVLLRVTSERVLSLLDTCLTERERTVIVRRYGLDQRECMTQRALAELLGISRSYVSRIEKAALEKLEAALSLPTPDSE
ncbi:MAG: RNA polymerase sporulation sigma factor SigK [Clostridia bacterium]|nr:RNA polymerase sporulation sigma factor SigK [Clostridia bacterium]